MSASKIKDIIIYTYILAILAAFVWFPLITLHGYRQWWVDMFYAEFAIAVIGGSIGHYVIVRRNRKS